jgi:hypothetical protein
MSRTTRFRIGPLLWIATVLAVAYGWWSTIERYNRERRRLVEEIHNRNVEIAERMELIQQLQKENREGKQVPGTFSRFSQGPKRTGQKYICT